MNIFIVHAHPEKKSFDGALTRTAVAFLKEQGHEIGVFDVLPPFIAWSPAHLDDTIRGNYLEAYQGRFKAVENTEPIKYPSLKEYDQETFQLKKKED